MIIKKDLEELEVALQKFYSMYLDVIENKTIIKLEYVFNYGKNLIRLYEKEAKTDELDIKARLMCLQEDIITLKHEKI